MVDFEKVGASLFKSVKDWLAPTFQDIDDRFRDLEARALERGECGARGERGERGEKGDPGRDGRDGAIGAAGPQGTRGEKGEPGRDGAEGRPGERGERGERGEPGERGEKGEPGRGGKDGLGIDRVELDADGKSFDLVLCDGSRATVPLSAGPEGAVGKDGRDGRDGADGARGEPGERGEKGDPGRSVTADDVEAAIAKMLPGLLSKAVEVEVDRIMPALVARAALLVPPGRDGLPGTPGLPGERGDDGKDGRDGADGLGFDDLDVKHDGERLLTLSFARGDARREFNVKLATPLYRGVFESGRQYEKGDTVTYGGSIWIAQRDTGTPPGNGSDWKLAVKRGRDGKGGSE